MAAVVVTHCTNTGLQAARTTGGLIAFTCPASRTATTLNAAAPGVGMI